MTGTKTDCVLIVSEFKKESHFASERDAYGADHQSEINIAGRITLNLWRLMRHEVTLKLLNTTHKVVEQNHCSAH